MKKFFKEFRDFINRGNVVDMAVGVIIGAAFKAIVDSLVADLIMPVISLVTGGIDFSNWFISLDGSTYATLAAAKEAGAATLNYGTFLTAIINFLIMAFVIFLLVRGMNRVDSLRHRNDKPAAPTTKVCPYCKSEIAIEATKCPHCTSDLAEK